MYVCTKHSYKYYCKWKDLHWPFYQGGFREPLINGGHLDITPHALSTKTSINIKIEFDEPLTPNTFSRVIYTRNVVVLSCV